MNLFFHIVLESQMTNHLLFLKTMKMKLIRNLYRILNLKKIYQSHNIIHFHLWKIDTIPINKSLQVINGHLMILHILQFLLLHIDQFHLLYLNLEEVRDLAIQGSCQIMHMAIILLLILRSRNLCSLSWSIYYYSCHLCWWFSLYWFQQILPQIQEETIHRLLGI